MTVRVGEDARESIFKRSVLSMAARLLSAIRESPCALTILALIAAWIVVRPWGDYALNDDWTYAHMAKHFAASGKLEIDVPLAPNGLGQAFVGGIAVKLFGFSHTVLRVLTMGVACVGLWAVDW